MTIWSVTVEANRGPYVTQQVEASDLRDALEKAVTIPLDNWLEPENDGDET